MSTPTDLPPLPKAVFTKSDGEDVWTASSMHDYARDAVAASAPAAPVQEALSDAEIVALADRMSNTHESDLVAFARAVLAADAKRSGIAGQPREQEDGHGA